MTDEMDLNGPHWAFSLATYGEADVPKSCLYLQDNYGLDVNILLLGLYGAGRLGVGCSDADIVMLDETVRVLREAVIVPLRRIRRDMKEMALEDAGTAIRNQVKDSELRAEQLEQAMLARALGGLKPGGPAPDLAVTANRIVAHFAARSPAAARLANDRAAALAIATVVNAAADASAR